MPNCMGSYSAAGFRVASKAFMLQDWGSTDSNINRRRLGDLRSFRGGIKRRLTSMTKNNGGINNATTELQRLTPINAPFANPRSWNGWQGDQTYEMRKSAKDRCYDLYINP